jgi:resolvase-like protein
MVLDGYVRVSQVGRRSDERFISPVVQREQIERWAQLHGALVGHIFVELDESGGRSDRPLLMQAVERVERGESDGLVVAYLSRFGRSHLDGLMTIDRSSARPSAARSAGTARRIVRVPAGFRDVSAGMVDVDFIGPPLARLRDAGRGRPSKVTGHLTSSHPSSGAPSPKAQAAPASAYHGRLPPDTRATGQQCCSPQRKRARRHACRSLPRWTSSERVDRRSAHARFREQLRKPPATGRVSQLTLR